MGAAGPHFLLGNGSVLALCTCALQNQSAAEEAQKIRKRRHQPWKDMK